jgi:AraC-like DNA-binding protein
MRDGEALINGPVRGRAERTIEGRGQVVAALFTPAGFRPFVGGHQGRFTDRIVPAVTELGAAARAWEAADTVVGHDIDARIAALVTMLESRAPVLEPEGTLVNEAVALVAAEVSITRVDRLAHEVGIGVRRLQRLFAEHAGVSPKAVIQQHRLQEAAERVAHGESVRWTDVSYELGFADQAHFSRAFTATIGVAPERYARECQAAVPAGFDED